MRELITQSLQDLERNHRVRVLYAVESGSRAWGFASADSDYDVRFVYVHERDWYLTIQTKRDVIEEMLPNDLDLAGWDLRKALALLMKSNPSIIEWLSSPIVYGQDDEFMEAFRELAKRCYSPHRCFMHYRGMAVSNYRAYLQGEQVALKKYLYVVRPLLACRWIERGYGPAPMEFDMMSARVVEEAELKAAIDRLIEKKKAATEMGTQDRLPVVHPWIERELERLDAIKLPSPKLIDMEEIDEFFRSVVSSGA